MFATPCYGGVINTTTMMNYLNMTRNLDYLDISYDVRLLSNESMVTKARNKLVEYFLEDNYTHLMFIDSDMGFHYETILKLLNFDKPIVGCTYPVKKINWPKIIKNLKSIKDIKDLLKYSFHYINDINIKSGEFEKIDWLPTGFMLIKKEVFIKMMKEQPDKLYIPDYHTHDFKYQDKKHYDFFEAGVHHGEIRGKTGMRYYGEDSYFCKKWTDMGGEIWVYNPKHKLTHIGNTWFGESAKIT